MQMSTFRTALLAAAALAIAPSMAHAQDQNPRHEHGGDRGGGGGRPAPPQAPRAPAAVSAPLRAGNYGTPAPARSWSGGQPMVQTPPQRADRGAWSGGDQPQRPNRGVWPGGGQWRGDRAPGGDGAAPWQGNRGESRPTPPQGANAGQNWQSRGDWRGDNQPRRDDNRHGDNRNGDDRHWGGGDRGQWNNADRTNRGPWPNRGQGDNVRQHWNGGDRQGAWRENGHRWDANRWRNDNRYDWRRWRDTHHDLFRWRYNAPRGFHYRPVYRGFYLEPFFYGSSYWLADPFEYRLPPVDWPLRWVRYYDDALLVDVTTGEVVDVISNFFF
jgi:hypothetical protein